MPETEGSRDLEGIEKVSLVGVGVRPVPLYPSSILLFLRRDDTLFVLILSESAPAGAPYDDGKWYRLLVLLLPVDEVEAPNCSASKSLLEGEIGCLYDPGSKLEVGRLLDLCDV